MGRSICVELLAKSGIVPNSVILVDSSSSMLEHSLQFRRQSVALMQADALSLPIQSAFIDVFVSVLGDSYNDSAFWREVARVLRAGGKGFFTTPSHEWSDAFRAATERDAAAFELRDGGKILIPSLIFDPDIQIKLIEATGLVITKVANVDARALRSPISPKLRIVDQGPIVTAYEFSKPR